MLVCPPLRHVDNFCSNVSSQRGNENYGQGTYLARLRTATNKDKGCMLIISVVAAEYSKRMSKLVIDDALEGPDLR